MAIKSQLRLGQISGSLGHAASANAFTFSTGKGASNVSYLNFDTSNTDIEIGSAGVNILLEGDLGGSSFLNENNFSSNSATKLASQASIKAYVDSVAQGLNVKQSVDLASTADLVTSGGGKTHTYSAGSGGSGGTITKDAAGVENFDGQAVSVGTRILLKDQTQQGTNGIYSVTTKGTALAAAVLSLDFSAGIPGNNETLKITVGSGSEQTITFRGGAASSDSSFSGNAADIGTSGQSAAQVATAIRTLLGSLTGVTGGGSGDIATATGTAGAANNIVRGTDTMGDGGSGPTVSLISATDAAAQVLTRAVDADGNAQNGNAELAPGSFFFVTLGTSHADKGFVMNSDTALPANNAAAGTAITFTQFSSAGSFLGGDGIELDGQTFKLNLVSVASTESGDLQSSDKFAFMDDSDGADDTKLVTFGDMVGTMDGTGLTASSGVLSVDASQAITALTGGDLTIFDDNNNADVSLSLGTSATEALVIEVLNGGSNKTAESVKFTTKTASATANSGKFEFAVDESGILEIDDSGIDFTSGKGIKIAGTQILTAAQLAIPRVELDGDRSYDNADGIVLHVDTGTLTDSDTGSGSALARAAAVVFEAPTLAASNTGVTTTDAATVYISAAPSAGTNQTLTRAYALWADAGKVRIDGGIMAGTVDIINSSGEILVDAQPNITSLGVLSSAQINNLQLGHASDTTLTRVSSGVVAVEGQELAMKTFKEHVDITVASHGDDGIPAGDSMALPTSADDTINYNVRFLAASSDERDVYVNGQLLLEGSNGVDDWYIDGSNNFKLNFDLEVGDVVQLAVRHKGS